jgi:hypothetical protein
MLQAATGDCLAFDALAFAPNAPDRVFRRLPSGPDLCLFFAPYGCDDPEILPS